MDTLDSEILRLHIVKRAESSLKDALDRAMHYLRDPEHGELARRMLWARTNVYNDVFGRFALGQIQIPYKGQTVSLGYGPWSDDTVIDRLSFLSFFIGHEILDDGEPCIVHWRYGWMETVPAMRAAIQAGDMEAVSRVYETRRGLVSEYVLCSADDEGATPFVDQCQEIHGYNDKERRWNRPPVRDSEQVIAVFDFHERALRERIADEAEEYGSQTLAKIDPATTALRAFLTANNLVPVTGGV